MLLSLLLLLFLFHVTANIEPVTHKAARYIVRGLQKAESEGAYGNKPTTSKDMYASDHEQCQIKVYRPELFKMLRSHAEFSESDFLNCLSINQLECVSSDSKSGAAFWRSVDGNIVVKTIKHYECKTMREILDDYTRHIVSREHSCIARVLGVYRVKLMESDQKVYFIVCKNVYTAPTVALEPPLIASVSNVNSATSPPKQPLMNVSNDTKLVRTTCTSYDLKGSSVGRWKSPTSSVLKDNDLHSSRQVFRLGPRGKNLLLDTLLRDSSFMLRHNLMDYSLLVQVQHVVEVKKSVWTRLKEAVLLRRRTRSSGSSDSGGANTVSDRTKLVLMGEDGLLYHFGIIDFLQRYTLRKRLENFLKGFYCDNSKVSCVAPVKYADRMIDFLDRVTQ